MSIKILWNLDLPQMILQILNYNFSLFTMEAYHSKSGHKHVSKQNQQSISIFNYYLKVLFPTILKTHTYPPKDYSKVKVLDRNIVYNYTYQRIMGGEGFSQQCILQAGKLTYFSNQCSKVRQNSFLKSTVVKLPYLPIWKDIKQQMDIFVLKQDEKSQQMQKNGLRSPFKYESNTANELRRKRSHPLISINKKQRNTKENESYVLYIIRYCNFAESGDSFRWENFIERYTFKTQKTQNEANSFITYETIFSYNAEPSLLQINQSQIILQSFYQMNIFTQKNGNKFLMLQKLTNKLRNLIQINKSKANLQQQSSSFDKSHRRQLRLTQQQKVTFNNLKMKTFAYFAKLNHKRQANRYFLQNLICRMMESQGYKQTESLQAIKYYLQFEKKMRDKYKWSSFQKYNQMNIFSYIGKDMMGRPILLNRLRNALCSKIQNFDDFFDYHMYLFEIYMQDHMEGWVDQFFVIADVSNQVADNTNLGFTKRILTEAYKITIGRVFKIVAFDISFLGTALYRVLKPFLPNSLIDIIRIIGDDRNELLQELKVYISDEAIPEFLGGKNQTLETKAIKDEPKAKGYTEQTTDRSMLKRVRSLKHL